MTGHPDNEATERAAERDALDAALIRLEETNGAVDEDAVTTISNRLRAETEEMIATRRLNTPPGPRQQTRHLSSRFRHQRIMASPDTTR